MKCCSAIRGVIPDPVHDASLLHLEEVAVEDRCQLGVLLEGDHLVDLGRLVDVEDDEIIPEPRADHVEHESLSVAQS